MIKRLIEPYLLKSMEDYPSVAIFGPRQSGKTTLAKSLFPNFSYANLEDINTRLLAIEDPNEFFVKYPEPVIIDEIQRVPELLSTVQVRIDNNQKKGQYLITGSQQLSLKNAVFQTLAGRIAIIHLYPLSMLELKNANIELDRDVQILAGGMPYLYKEEGLNPTQYYNNYINTYIERDVAQLTQIHNLTTFSKFLTLLAGRIGQLVNMSSLANDTGVSSTTINSWLSILEASHIIYRLKPWFTSRTSQLVKTPKIYFCDTGIAANLLGLTSPSQVSRDPLIGGLFENLVVTEAIKAMADKGINDNLYFFRNSNGLEVDLLKSDSEGLDLFEIKSGKAMLTEYLNNMNNYGKKYSFNNMSVIYSGENVPSFKDASFINFHDVYHYFSNKEEPYKLKF